MMYNRKALGFLGALLGMIGVTAFNGEKKNSAKQPRGIRNNNPLNIELGESWQGLEDSQTDGRFAQFVDARYGYRAAARILRSYKARGVETLGQIISTWAPDSENNTSAYASHVADKMGVSVNTVLHESDYPALFAAMTLHENGQQPYSIEFIAEGVSWA